MTKQVTEEDVTQTCEVHGFPLDPEQLEVVTAVVNQILLSAAGKNMNDELIDRLKQFKKTRHGESIWLGDGVHDAIKVDELIAALSASKPAVPDDDFLKICQEEMARGSITSLPMKLGMMAARGFASIEEVEDWMRTTRRNFVAAVTAATAASPAAPAQSGEPVMTLLRKLKRDLMHARRFGDDTLAAYRRTCSEAEGEIEAFLAAPQPSPSAVVLDDEQAALTSNQFAAIRAGAAALEKIGGYAVFGPVLQAMLDSSRATPPQPVAQTERALTDQMLEKLYWTAMDNAADILRYMGEARSLLTAAQPTTEVGIASAMPGVDAWTVTVCKAEDVPVGTPLYKKGN